MKIDTPFPQPPVAAPPRPLPHTPDQASARPVDRPHHDEAAENGENREAVPDSESGKTAAARDSDNRRHASASGHDSEHQTPPRNATEPSRVGELLDVLA